jgi:hypothetical protein
MKYFAIKLSDLKKNPTPLHKPVHLIWQWDQLISDTLSLLVFVKKKKGIYEQNCFVSSDKYFQAIHDYLFSKNAQFRKDWG